MINIKFLDLPCKVKAVSTVNEDSTYTVVINSKLNYEQQIEGYLHELFHIDSNDFYRDKVEKIEYRAHKRRV